MANLHLVTGYAGQAHITAEDHGSLNAAIVGSGNYVLNRGNRLSASAITSNQIRVLDGDLLLQGRHVRLAENSYVDLTIDSGAQGMYRNDLIVARYTKNSSTGVEECNLVVIKGTAVTGSPSDPTYTDGDILGNHDAQADFPLYRVSLDGLAVEVEQLFEIITFVTVGADGKIKSDYLPSMNYIPTSQKGAASGVAPLNANKKVAVAYLPVGEANGVAGLGSDGKIPSSQLPETMETDSGTCTVVPVSDSLWTAAFSTGGWSRYGRFVYAELIVQFEMDSSLAWDQNPVKFYVSDSYGLANKVNPQAVVVSANVGTTTKYGQVVGISEKSGDTSTLLISVIGLGGSTNAKLESGDTLAISVNLSYMVDE